MPTVTRHHFPAISFTYPKIFLAGLAHEAHNLLAGSPHEACGGAAAGLRQAVRRRHALLSVGVSRKVA